MGKDRSEAFSEKMSLFNKLPDECLACTKAFDKKDKEMVTTWNVVVREPDIVRLYCPECWDKAQKIVSEYEKNNQ